MIQFNYTIFRSRFSLSSHVDNYFLTGDLTCLSISLDSPPTKRN